MGMQIDDSFTKEVGNRIKNLRKERGLSQADVISWLSVYLGKKERMGSSLVSGWELGNKTPSYPCLIALAALFNVPTDYILGVTDDKVGVNDFDIINYVQEIKVEMLATYDNCPVLISHENTKENDEWGIYDAERKVFFCNGRIIRQRATDRYYATVIGSNQGLLRRRPKLTISRAESLSMVWLEYKGSDSKTTMIYSGWYKPNPELSCFESLEGIKMPYTGMDINYSVYEFPRKIL